MVREGFEPSKLTRQSYSLLPLTARESHHITLISVQFFTILHTLEYGAGTRIRTVDLLITSQLLYQLSYAGNVQRIIANFVENASQKMSG